VAKEVCDEHSTVIDHESDPPSSHASRDATSKHRYEWDAEIMTEKCLAGRES
jgi:hypothetical protein